MPKNDIDIRVGASVDRNVERQFDKIAQQSNRARKTTIGGASRSARAVDRLGESERRLERRVGNATRTQTRQNRTFAGAATSVRKYSRGIRDAISNNKQLERSNRTLGAGLDKLSNKWTAIGGTATGIATAASVMNLQQRMTQLGIQAGVGDGRVDKLKSQIFNVSQKDNIRINPDELISAVEKIVEKTGNLDLAQLNLETIGLAIRATGSTGEDIGTFVADMVEKFGIKTEEGIRSGLDSITLQGKAGAFTLANMASMSERATAPYAALGRSGPEGLNEMGALMQMAMKGTGVAENATTAYAAVLRDLTTNQETLRDEFGIQIWDEDALAQGREQARSVADIIKEVMVATGGNNTGLRQIFGDEAKRALDQIAIEYQKTGGFAEFDKFLAVQGDGTQLMEDSARAAAEAAASLSFFVSVWREMTDDKLGGVIDGFASLSKSFSPETAGKVMAGGSALGILISGLIAKRSAGAAIGKMSKFLGAAGGAGQAAAAAPGTLSRIGGVASGFAKRATVPIAIGAGGLSIVANMANDELTGTQKVQRSASDIGGIAGTIGGAAAGAAMGSVVPVIGTVFGGLAGAVVGSMGGSAIIGGLVKKIIGGDAGDDAGQAVASSIDADVARLAATGAGGGNYNLSVSQTINQQPGEDGEALAARVRSEMELMLEEMERGNRLSYRDIG